MRWLNRIYLHLHQTGKIFLDWRATLAAKGIEGVPDSLLYLMMFLFTLQITMCGLLLKEVWPPFRQLLQLWRTLPLKIKLEVGLISIPPLCALALIAFLTPTLSALNDEYKRRLKG